MSELKVKRGTTRATDPVVAARELYDAIFDPAAELMVFYASAVYDLEALGAALHALFGDAPLIGCTTAGEITPIGYLDGAMTGVSLAGDLAAVTVRLDGLRELQLSSGDLLAKQAIQALRMRGAAVNGRNCFGFLVADGLSMQEEGLIASIYRHLGDISLFGGSAGDGTRFGRTAVYHGGRFASDAALFTLVSTQYPFLVFKTQHFVESSDKMVITGADPSRRIVTEINGEPAGREYARAVGLEVDKLTPLIFATYPVVVRIGGATWVRSIQKVNDDESLTFFCAIDEGVVLTVARGVDMLENLEESFAEVRRLIGEPTVILGCDCILRNLEAEQRGIKERVGEIMAANQVIGFATYGEQFNAMHVNQTFTGVAIGKKGAVG